MFNTSVVKTVHSLALLHCRTPALTLCHALPSTARISSKSVTHRRIYSTSSMTSDTRMDSAILSENPFSDEYVVDTDAKLEDAPSATAKTREIIVPAKYTGPVPILEPLPHLTAWSSQSSIFSSSTTSSPTEPSFTGPILWNNADLSASLRRLHMYPQTNTRQCIS
jgi:hypothetical protein